MVRLDMRAALEMAQAEGCAPAIAAPLLRAVQEGLALAQAGGDGVTGSGRDGE